MQILIMGLQILTPSCAIVWISQNENCQCRFSKAGNPFWSVMQAFFFLLLMHSIILLWLAYMLLYNIFHFFFFSWTIHVSMYSAQEWHNLVCLPSGNCISSCASHYVKILRWSLCSHPYLFLNSSAPATFSPFFSSLSQSFHSFKTVSIQSPHHLRPITLWFLCSHTVIHPHSAPSCPFTNHSSTLLPWIFPPWSVVWSHYSPISPTLSSNTSLHHHFPFI